MGTISTTGGSASQDRMKLYVTFRSGHWVLANEKPAIVEMTSDRAVLPTVITKELRRKTPTSPPSQTCLNVLSDSEVGKASSELFHSAWVRSAAWAMKYSGKIALSASTTSAKMISTRAGRQGSQLSCHCLSCVQDLGVHHVVRYPPGQQAGHGGNGALRAAGQGLRGGAADVRRDQDVGRGQQRMPRPGRGPFQ